jgi:CheY-like chemotaxis protein
MRRADRESCPLASTTVLVVDDHEDTRVMFAEYLGWHGAHTIAVPDVREAMSVLAGIQVDVVITDVAMPSEDGYALIARMDGDPAFSSIPRVIVSGQSSPDEAYARDARAYYLSKPVALDELLRIVRIASAPAAPAHGPAGNLTATR